MKRHTGLLIILAWGALFLSGCFDKPPLEQTPGQPAPGYRVVTDSTGYVLHLPQKPQRIIPLSIGTDEILTALVPVERIAALTYLADDGGISNITAEAKNIPFRVRASAEPILSLQPDLVITPDWQPSEVIQILRESGIAVYVYKQPTMIEPIKQTIAELAGVVGEVEAGARIVAKMDAELTEITGITGRIPSGDRQIAVRFTLMGGSGGKGSTFDDVCRWAGVKNGAAIAGLEGDGTLSKEQIVTVNPDLLIMPTWDYTGKTDLQQFRTSVEQDPALQSVTAIQRRRLISIPDCYLYCSSQYIVQGVRAMAEAAYPHYFNNRSLSGSKARFQ